MARFKILGALRALKKLRGKVEDLDWKGTFDGERVKDVQFDFSLVGTEVRISSTFTVAGNSHTLNATYTISDQESEEIQFDGQEVEEDEVDFDLDNHFLYSKLEYWFRFVTQAGDEHELYLRAKAPWKYLF